MGLDNYKAKWTKEEEYKLVNIYCSNDWKSLKDIPYKLLEEKFPSRSADAIRSKLRKLIKSEHLDYTWDKEESRTAFAYYLEGLPFKEILDKLHAQGSNATMEQLESELKRSKFKAESMVRAYAEERGLSVAKYITPATLVLFRDNYNTKSSFIRKGLHSRIANG